ncbi:MAG: hypothetical protein ROZ64_08705 [Burkholderiaceae bacterium]|jgi:hypothetical protein|nr:hypothetical protein [Burkholderiaceae bacterium]
MDAPLTRWYCDTCEEQIEKAEDGYVVWKNPDSHGPHSFKIIHQRRCDPKRHHFSQALADFLGPDGLAHATTLLSVGTVMKRRGIKSSAPGDVDAWVDFVRRLQLPYYEEARRCFKDPEYRDDMSDANEVLSYLERSLKDTIKRYGEKS